MRLFSGARPGTTTQRHSPLRPARPKATPRQKRSRHFPTGAFPAATLILTQHLWVRVYVPETWLGHIHLNDNVKVRVDSFPGRDFAGTVEQINREAEFTPRNVQTVEERIKQVFGVKVRLKNEEDKLRAGMSADVEFPGVPK